jgi:hypothetical protein
MGTSHLEMSTLRRGDVDLIIAAGLVKETMGTMLYRLMAEYDNARGDCSLARRNSDASAARAKAELSLRMAAEEHRRRRRGDPDLSPLDAQALVVELAKAIREQAKHETQMAHAFVLLKLKSLPEVKQRFGAWSMSIAQRVGFMECGPMPKTDPDKDAAFHAWRERVRDRLTIVNALSGRVLDALLDPTCHECQGRGFSGGYDGSPQILCTRRQGCGGSGRRKTTLGKNPAQHDFALYLFDESSMMLTEVERQMRLARETVDEAKTTLSLAEQQANR